MKFDVLEQELLKDKRFRNLHKTYKVRLKFLIAQMLIDTRCKKQMTQKELALELGTTQSSIARLESGNVWPKLEFLKRIADVYEMDLLPPRFESNESSFEGIMSRIKNDIYKVELEESTMITPIKFKSTPVSNTQEDRHFALA